MSAPAAAVAWSWRAATIGAVYALPAGVLATEDLSYGLALAVGVLPAAITGVAPKRRGRIAILLLGALVALPMLVGGALGATPVVAVAAIALLGPATAYLATRSRVGLVAMNLSLPMVGIGLSYSELGEVAGLAALIFAGSAFACLIAMTLPERAAAARATVPPAPVTLDYGVRLGAAGAGAAAIGFALDLEHVGWACAAALLVMRPAPEMQRLRSVGRIAAVAVGALLAIALVRREPAAGWYGLAAVGAVAGAAATHGSRWYVVPAFTTFLVFLLLLGADPAAAGARFAERLGETLLGVGFAYAFGLALPALLERRRRSGTPGGRAAV